MTKKSTYKIYRCDAGKSRITVKMQEIFLLAALCMETMIIGLVVYIAV